MKLQTHANDINVYTNEEARVNVSKIVSGYGLAVYGHPYPEYIVEWEYSTCGGSVYKSRELIVLPEKDTAEWLVDLIADKKERGYTLIGLMPLYEITLAKYLG